MAITPLHPVVVTFLTGATTATATVQTTEEHNSRTNRNAYGKHHDIHRTSRGYHSHRYRNHYRQRWCANGSDNHCKHLQRKASPVNFSFTLSIYPSSVATSYTFTLTNGTAGSSDYTTTNVTVVVPAGATTGTVSVPTTQDTIDELDETFTIS